MPIRIVVEIDDENIKIVSDYYEEYTGKKPNARWLRKFLKEDAEFRVNFDLADDDLADAVLESIPVSQLLDDCS